MSPLAHGEGSDSRQPLRGVEGWLLVHPSEIDCAAMDLALRVVEGWLPQPL